MIEFFLVALITVLNYQILFKVFVKSKILSVINKSVVSSIFSIGLVLLSGELYFVPLLLMTLLFSMTHYYTSMYGEVSYGSVASIIETNISEAKEYIGIMNRKLTAITALLSIIYFISHFAFVYMSNLPGEVEFFLKLLSSSIFILSLVSYMYIYMTDKPNNKRALRVLRFNSITNMLAHIGEYYKYKRMTNRVSIESKWIDVKVTGENKDVYIVVIGESARRDRFHVYGYGVENTPGINAMQGYSVVRDAISPATQTMTSLPRMLSLSSNDDIEFDLNIIDLANDAGFETYWISNQGRLGSADTAVTLLAERASYCHFLQHEYSAAGSDFVLLDEVRSILEKDIDKPQLIFLHTMGSHWDFCERSKLGSYQLDRIEDQSDCYDNTIYNTYKLLEDIRALTNDYGKSYRMTYFSDHGLAVTSNYPYLTHGVGKLFSFDSAEVPLFFIDDNHNNGEFIDKTYYMRDFTYTLSDWMNISAKQIDLKLSILNADCSKQDDYILDDNLNVVKRN